MGLDDDRVEFALALHQPFDDADQIAAHGAADTAVVHFEDFFVGADNEIVVDADLAEFIDDDGEFSAVRFAQDTIEQRRFARAEIAGENGDGNFFGHAKLRGNDRGRQSSADRGQNGGQAARQAPICRGAAARA